MDETKSQCAECGAEVPPDAPLGLCPACLLKRAMAATTAGAGRSSAGGWSGGFDPPPVEQLAPLFPQLEVIEFIGRGGMGAVYKARQPHLDRFVAVKILPTSIADDPAFAERFAREARSLARLSHANIVTVHDFGRAGEYFFFVMEFVDGANLRQALLAKTLQPKQALAIVPQICDALQYAHDEGIVHRDIKPENVLLDKKGRVKIADFGLAKLLQKTPQNYTLTQTSVTMGTPHYMAPEQTERPLEVDHRADIYSLGVVFYEMLTGELPLGRFAPPSQKAAVDARLDDVVFKTLEKEPARRYQQASEVKTGVQEASASAPPRAAEPDRPQAVLPYAQRHPPESRRYSRMAFVGLAWGALGLLSLLFMAVLGTVIGGVALLTIPFLLLVFTAVIGMPLCGLVAIAQIRQSNGRLGGLRLAVLDVVLIPLLILNAALIALPAVGLGWFFRFSPAEAFGLMIVLGLPLCAVLDFFIVRFLWRRISARLPEYAVAGQAAPAVSASDEPRRGDERSVPVMSYGGPARYSRTAICGAAWVVVGLLGPALLIASYFLVRQSRVVAAPVPVITQQVAVGGASVGDGLSYDVEWPDRQAMREAAQNDPLARRAIGMTPTTRNTTATGTANFIVGGGGGGGGATFARVTVTPAPPTWWSIVSSPLRLAMFPLLAVAFTAPFGATILGLVAISQIRQSNGRLCGMPLAVFDSLVFPLLLLDVLIVAGIPVLYGSTVAKLLGATGGLAHWPAVLVAAAVAAVADVWLVRRVRDAVRTAPAAG